MPQVKRNLSEPLLLYQVVQLLLTYDPAIVQRVASLLLHVLEVCSLLSKIPLEMLGCFSKSFAVLTNVLGEIQIWIHLSHIHFPLHVFGDIFDLHRAHRPFSLLLADCMLTSVQFRPILLYL